MKTRTKIDVFAFNVNKKESQTWRKRTSVRRKAKKLYLTSDENLIWVEYLDQATALNGARKDQISGKGELNNQITSTIFRYLTQRGIKNHFIEQLSKTEQLVKKYKSSLWKWLSEILQQEVSQNV